MIFGFITKRSFCPTIMTTVVHYFLVWRHTHTQLHIYTDCKELIVGLLEMTRRKRKKLEMRA